MIAEKPFTLRLRKEFVSKKLFAVESDLSEKNLGLSSTDGQTLIKKISIIFHVAASVKFEAPLEVNMRHNVVATRELLELACRFKQLLCFVHVSTAYSNCQLRQIDERIYPMDVPKDPMSLQVTKSMIDSRPNTYTYTKAMAENVAAQYAARMNVVIVRPSIVMSSMKEPAQGWVDTINGPVGLSVLGALGILQKIKVNSEVVFDLIPADIVTNALVVIAWAATEKRSEFLPGSSPSLASGIVTTENEDENENENNVQDNNNNIENVPPELSSISEKIKGFEKQQTANKVVSLSQKKSPKQQEPGSNDTSFHSLNRSTNNSLNSSNSKSNNLDGTVRVFNLTTGSENPCSFYHYFSIGREEAYKKPSARALRPLLTIPKQKGMNSIQYYIHKIFSHLLFAYIIDTLLGLFGQKRMVVKAVNKMHHANEMFDYFCSNQWTFVTDNVKRLRQLQTPKDMDTFNCDVRVIDWNNYGKIGWLGCRRFILKEDDSTFDECKRRYRLVCLIYYLVKTTLLVTVTLLVKQFISSSTIVLALLLIPVYGIVYLL